MTKTALIVSLVGSAYVYNAIKPRQGRFTMLLGFFPAWLVTELAQWLLLWEALFAAIMIKQGLLSEVGGWAALGIMAANAAGLVRLWIEARGSGDTMQSALEGVATYDPDMPPYPLHHVRFPFFARKPTIETVRKVEFSRVAAHRLHADIITAPSRPVAGENRGLKPCLIQVHGGGWTTGFKENQARPLLWHMADLGWACFDIDYRLSPRASYPDHLVDVKSGIAWVRENAKEYGADPDFICITGGSAGGHLSALAALTAHRTEFQPGFEAEDTSVSAAVPYYGVYDFTNRLKSQLPEVVPEFYAPMIMKDFLEDAPQKFADYSPIDQVHADAPPFLVIHGEKDTLARVEDARLFVDELRKVSKNHVLFAELTGAHHAFDVFPSVRTRHVTEGVERFLTAIHSKYIAQVANQVLT